MNMRDVYRDLHKKGYNYNGRWHRRYFDVVQLARMTDARTVAEFGCEWGQVLCALRCAGMDVFGTTQIEDCLAHLQKIGLPCALATYADLLSYESESFDLVVSNDVLEHLSSEEQAIEAMRQMVRISRSWVIFTIGRKRSRLGRPYGVPDLHTLTRPREWWHEQVDQLVELQPLPFFTSGNPDGFPVLNAYMFLGKK